METKTGTEQEVKQQGPALQNDIIIQRVFDLPISRVWQAWTDAEQFKDWWGPNGFTCPSSKMEARKGGTYLNCMRSPTGEEFWSTGVVKEFIPHRKLVLTDSFSDAEGNKVPASAYNMPGVWPDELLITVDLEEADGATKMRLVHEGIPEEMRDECIKGWNESFDKLEKNLR